MTQRLLTFREAAVKLNWVDDGATEAEQESAGRRLRWAVLVREKETGKRIATRLGHRVASGEPQARVTLGAIYRHFPEFRRHKGDDLAADFRRYLGEIEETIAEQAAEEIGRLVQPQVDEVHERIDVAHDTAERARAEAAATLQRLKELEKVVEELTRKRSTKKPEPTRADDGSA